MLTCCVFTLNVLPRSYDKDDAQRYPFDVPPETRLVGILQTDIRQGRLRDRQHIVCAFKETSDLSFTLGDRSAIYMIKDEHSRDRYATELTGPSAK